MGSPQVRVRVVDAAVAIKWPTQERWCVVSYGDPAPTWSWVGDLEECGGAQAWVDPGDTAARHPSDFGGEPLARTPTELGARIRQLRGKKNLRDAAKELGISKSSLSRYETEGKVPLDVAAAIDGNLRADGWVLASASRLHQARWKPWAADASVRECGHQWPAQYQGTVWIHIVPRAENVGKSHAVRLSWGPWRCLVELPLSAQGMVLTTGKAVDEGEAVTLRLQARVPLYVLFGAGDPATGPQLDLRDAWTSSHAS